MYCAYPDKTLPSQYCYARKRDTEVVRFATAETMIFRYQLEPSVEKHLKTLAP
jgi:hypothetical protein